MAVSLDRTLAGCRWEQSGSGGGGEMAALAGPVAEARLLGAVRAGELTAARLKDLVAASRSWEAKVSALQTDAARLIAQQESHGDGGASVLRDQAGKSRFQARRNLGAAPPARPRPWGLVAQTPAAVSADLEARRRQRPP